MSVHYTLMTKNNLCQTTRWPTRNFGRRNNITAIKSRRNTVSAIKSEKHRISDQVYQGRLDSTNRPTRSAKTSSRLDYLWGEYDMYLLTSHDETTNTMDTPQELTPGRRSDTCRDSELADKIEVFRSKGDRVETQLPFRRCKRLTGRTLVSCDRGGTRLRSSEIQPQRI